MRTDYSRGSRLAFNDLLFNLLVGTVVLFFFAFIYMNPVAKNSVLDPRAEFLVITEWDKDSRRDIDTWIRNDNNSIVGFTNLNFDLMHLDRDDTGRANDTIRRPDGTEEHIQINREVISIRTKEPRTYEVSIHYFSKGHKGLSGPETVTVELIQVTPYEVLEQREIVLEFKQEKPVFGFTVDEDGNVTVFDSSAFVKRERVQEPNEGVPE